MNLNHVELIGGGEPETTYTPNGKAVATFSVATKTSWVKGDERQERTEWHRVQAWAQLARICRRFQEGEPTSLSKANSAAGSTRPTMARRSART